MAGQFPRDAYVLADLGSLVKVLVDQLDSGAMDSEQFVREVRDAVRKTELAQHAEQTGPPKRPRV